MVSENDTLRRHEKVVAAEDLPGVPAGTRGKVILVAGITWIRYRVLFDNGMDLGSIDRSCLVRVGEFEERERERRRAEREAEREAAIAERSPI